MASTTKGPIERFFKRYIQYTYDPNAPVWAEYERMSETLRYEKNNKKGERARTLLRQAIVDEFDAVDGEDEKQLAFLRRLCQRLEIFPLPNSVRYRDDMKSLATGDKAGNAIVWTAGPMDLFFSRYNQFDYDPHSKVWSEYHRLCKFFGWNKGSTKEKTERKLFRQALVDEFGAIYGVDDNKLDVLQRLCEKLEINPLPQTLTDCKEVIQAHYVNIVDFVDCERTGKPIPKFVGLEQLQRYTIETEKIFPKWGAKASLLLRLLLQRIFDE
ncbi:hypothetical protein E4U59_000653 [Claviceps monticola]|nr:hypothetical protein E4U59_000653 [Claviceps monticola]